MSVWSSWRVLHLRTAKSRVRLSGNIIFRLRLHQNLDPANRRLQVSLKHFMRHFTLPPTGGFRWCVTIGWSFRYDFMSTTVHLSWMVVQVLSSCPPHLALPRLVGYPGYWLLLGKPDVIPCRINILRKCKMQWTGWQDVNDHPGQVDCGRQEVIPERPSYGDAPPGGRQLSRLTGAVQCHQLSTC